VGKLRVLEAGGGSSGEMSAEALIPGLAEDVACCFPTDGPASFPLQAINCKRTNEHTLSKSVLRNEMETGDPDSKLNVSSAARTDPLIAEV
jgi:hypothetical protein